MSFHDLNKKAESIAQSANKPSAGRSESSKKSSAAPMKKSSSR